MSESDSGSLTLLVGGTGTTGRRVAPRLVQAGRPVRVGAPDGEVPFLWEDPRTWSASLEDVERVYIAHPEVTEPVAAEQIAAFASFAAERGGRHIVLLSGRGPDLARPAEQAVEQSGTDWTILRPGWFNQNFDEGFFLDAVLAGRLEMPVGDAVEAFIDAEDIADVVAVVLGEPGHGGKMYELSGPRSLTFGQVAAELSAATGRDIAYVAIDPDEYRQASLAEGYSEEYVDAILTYFDGTNGHVVDGVERLLGRPARDFSEYAKKAATKGTWTVRN